MRINCIPVTKHQFAALNVAYTQQHYEFQLLSAGSASFAFPKYFLSKVFSSETQHWPVGGSGILAGCCMIQCFLLFSCITVCRREERVMEKSQRQRCHCKLACMTVPGSNCKAFLALLFSFFLFFFVTVLACHCHKKENTAESALTREDHFSYSSFISLSTQLMSTFRCMVLSLWVRAIWN